MWTCKGQWGKMSGQKRTFGSLMATVALPQDLSMCSQVQQLGSSAGALLSSLCESTASAFVRVHVTKRGADGNLLCYDHKDPVTGAVTQKEHVFTYIKDVKSGALFLDDTQFVVRVKCVLLAIGALFYTPGTMVWRAVKTALVTSIIAVETLAATGKLFLRGKCKESAAALKKGATSIATECNTGLYDIVKAPVCGLGCILAALYGIAKPYHGRKFEAMIENIWQNGASYKEDRRYTCRCPSPARWKNLTQEIKKPYPFYLAWCFQPRGKITDNRYTLIKSEPL